MSYVKLNINKPSGGAAPQSKQAEVVIVDLADVATWPNRDSKGVVMSGSIVFAANKYAIKMQVTGSKTSLPLTSEGEEDAVGFTSLPEFQFPGNSVEFLEFISNWTNKNIAVAIKVGACDGGTPYYQVYGTPCNPLSLLIEGQNDNEKTASMVKFQQFTKSKVVTGVYYGTFTFDSATTVSADATTVDVTNGSGEYQLQDNTGATEITDLVNAAVGGVYTLIGSGGSNAATIDSGGNFFLTGGATWTGDAGATLTVRAHDAGSSDFFFVEVSRT